MSEGNSCHQMYKLPLHVQVFTCTQGILVSGAASGDVVTGIAVRGGATGGPSRRVW